MTAVLKPNPVIAVLGGAGKHGGGLALRWANAGYRIVVGSRTPERAQAAAQQINQALGREAAVGASNAAAARAASIVVLAVSFAAQRAIAEEAADELRGKILVDVTVPLVPPKVGRMRLPDGGSAVEALQAFLGPETTVVSAFQNISAHRLSDLTVEIDCDVLVCADDASAGDLVVDLAREIGLRAWNGGPLANSVAAEALTSVLITLNRHYKVPDSGIRITDVPAAACQESP